MKKSIFLAFIVSFSFIDTHAQSIIGKWQTIDEETGQVRSVVEISENHGLFNGKIVKLFPASGKQEDVICSQCNDHRKNKKVLGMIIISNMKYVKADNRYKGGEILDPNKGKVYRSEIWLDDSGDLKVRGYISFLYRTQTWKPYTE